MRALVLLIYRLIWLILGMVVPVILRWRARHKKEDLSRRQERYGHASRPRPSSGHLYWLHGASVGETVSSLVLAKAMINANPDAHVLITSGTVTSAKMLEQRIETLGLSARITHQYHPYDHPVWIKRFLDHWRPDLVVMMESEIWPNMVMMSNERRHPVAMASAQISEKSLRYWAGRGHLLARTMFPVFRRIITVDAIQEARFDSLPTRPGTVLVGGSMKAAAPALTDNPELRQQITAAADGRLVVLMASSHDGEEKIFLDAMSAVNQSGGFMSVIAPRHIVRGAAIRQMVEAEGMTTGQHSRGEPPAPNQQVFIADMMGEMGGLIRAADIIVLGGAFGNIGGHNPMEMAALDKGVISGPHTFKNTAAFELIDTHGGLITASTSSAVADAITVLAASATLLDKHNHGAAKAYQVLADAAAATAQVLMALTNDGGPQS
ncbi:MAG: hypothetical protein J4F41_03125 [Alphaproteobacteria bacterium]|nr:hypothetical protein [Alphaproteobacteria bacterium]